MTTAALAKPPRRPALRAMTSASSTSGTRSAGSPDRMSALKSLIEGLNKTIPKEMSLKASGGGLSVELGYRMVKAGIPSSLLEPLADYLGLGKGEVATYVDMDRTTANRKIAKDEALPMHAAESLLRLFDITRMAEDTFETAAQADGWLKRAHPMLDGETPLDCAKSAFGAQRVKDILVAVKYGGVV